MTILYQNKFTRGLLPFLLILVFISCKKNVDSDPVPTGQTPDLTTTVTSSVSGFVTDENNAPVMGATVKVGSNGNTTTDKYGFFEVKNVTVIKDAALVTVTMNGYFKGIKTYSATNNKAAFFRIKLIPKTTIGTIDATAGGHVSLSNGLTIALPANAVMTAAGSVPYNGSVNVAAHWIDPTAADVTQTMPGDLRGIDANNFIKLLTSYGMAAVELTSTSGELLQIASGKKATLTMTIPASIAANAPATIPLWSFNEANGLWKEEGQATKNGNTYVGEVSHFSFWNCDQPNNFVQLDCTILDPSGNPIPYVVVKLTMVGTIYSSYGYTDASGFVAGLVPPNTQLLMEVFTNNCGTPVYSQTITTANANISLGTITAQTNQGIATVSGTVTDCNSAAVTNGYVYVLHGTEFSRYPITMTGTFNFPMLLCNNALTVSLTAEDAVSQQSGSPLSVNLVNGANNAGNLQACGISTTQFINYTIDGTPSTVFTGPPDALTTGFSVLGSQFRYIGGHSNFNPQASDFYLEYYNDTWPQTNPMMINSFRCSQFDPANTAVMMPSYVDFTEYGPIGQYIAGSFGCTVINISTSETHSVSGSFRVKRTN